MKLTKKERILNTFNYKELDKPAIYDKIHSLKFVEYVYGKAVNSKNAEDAMCSTIAKTCDMTRHVVVPYDLSVHTEKDEDGFIYRVDWNSKHIVERPFTNVTEAKELVKKDIFKIGESIDNEKFCHQAKWHLKLFGEDFEEPDELNEEFKRIQDKMDGTVVVAPEFFDGLGPVATRYNYDMLVYLYNDYPELIHELLEAHCKYQLFRIESFPGPQLSPVALMGTAISGTQGMIFSPLFLQKEFFPFAKRIVDKLKEKGYKVIFEMEGDTRVVFEEMIKTGTDAYTTVEERSSMSVEWIKSRYPRLVLAQMIDSTQLLTYGSVNDVIEKTKDIINILKEYGGILIGSSGDINEEVNIENVTAMIDTVKNSDF